MSQSATAGCSHRRVRSHFPCVQFVIERGGPVYPTLSRPGFGGCHASRACGLVRFLYSRSLGPIEPQGRGLSSPWIVKTRPANKDLLITYCHLGGWVLGPLLGLCEYVGGQPHPSQTRWKSGKGVYGPRVLRSPRQDGPCLALRPEIPRMAWDMEETTWRRRALSALGSSGAPSGGCFWGVRSEVDGSA